MDLGLRDRACVITGASRGIGKATAIRLAEEGARTLLIGRDESALNAAVERCPGARTLSIDITTPDASERIKQACLDAFGGIDVLVNNAGTSRARSADELTDAEWREQWELHVMAPMHLMRALAPAMAERGWGRIVNVSSSSGKRPGQRNIAYSVTKAAELSLSRAFADLYAGSGVLVNAITPGPVASELWMAPGGMADQVAKARGIDRDVVLEQTAKGVPIGRFGDEREIANVIAFLCSEGASYVTGAAWSVDGGAVPVIL